MSLMNSTGMLGGKAHCLLLIGRDKRAFLHTSSLFGFSEVS